MYKHTPKPPFCYGTVHIRVSFRETSRILQNGGTFFYVVHTHVKVTRSCVLFVSNLCFVHEVIAFQEFLINMLAIIHHSYIW